MPNKTTKLKRKKVLQWDLVYLENGSFQIKDLLKPQNIFEYAWLLYFFKLEQDHHHLLPNNWPILFYVLLSKLYDIDK